MATVKDIAELAGVSRGTVDRVLNSRGSVNPKTEARVREAARVLDYRPNKAGIALAAQKKKLKLGVVLFGEENPFFDEVMYGVRKKAEELEGYSCAVLIERVDFDVSSQLRAINSLVERGVNGIVLSPYNAPEISEKINELYGQGIPVVTSNTDIGNSKRLAYVGSNFYLSGQTAGGLMGLMTSGSVRVGIVTGSSQVLCHTERIAGFKDAVAKNYPDIQIVSIVKNHDDDSESYEVTKQLLESHPEINALFFSAAGVYGGCKALTASGRKKDEITVISYDNVPSTAELVRQGVIAATICQQPALQGGRPLDILFSYLTAGELPKEELNYVAVDIRIRENI